MRNAILLAAVCTFSFSAAAAPGKVEGGSAGKPDPAPVKRVTKIDAQKKWLPSNARSAQVPVQKKHVSN